MELTGLWWEKEEEMDAFNKERCSLETTDGSGHTGPGSAEIPGNWLKHRKEAKAAKRNYREVKQKDGGGGLEATSGG